MRPLEVTLEGFKSYRHLQTFNFESRSLFGIVGPTGSGKSTILEALIFALYGKTPRLQRETKRLINSREEQARVQLIFEVDSALWEVARIIRRKGTSQTLLRNLTDSSVEPISGERFTNEKIEELVGLDFDGFCSSVLLPQGEFDRFLRAAPADRSKILKGIFRLERVDLLRERARSAYSSLEGQITVLRASVEALPFEPEKLLQSVREQSAAAASRLREIGEALPRVIQAEQDLRTSADQMKRLREAQKQTQDALSRLPAEEALREIADRQEACKKRLQLALMVLANTSESLRHAEAAEAIAERETGGQVWIAAVNDLLAQWARLTESSALIEKELDGLTAAQEAVGRAQESAAELLQVAQQTRTSLVSELSRLEQMHAAHLLRLDLHDGQPCPVCEQQVRSVPKSAQLPALEIAQQNTRRAEEEWSRARTAFERADRDSAVGQERLRLAEDSRAKVLQELERVAAALASEAGSDPSAELVKRRSILETARSRTVRARTEREAADGAERSAREELDRMTASNSATLNLLTHTCGVLGMASFAASEEGLWEVSKRIIEVGTAQLEALSAEIAASEKDLYVNTTLLAEFTVRFAAGRGVSAADLFAEAKAELTRLQLRATEVEEGIEKRRQAEEQIELLTVRRARFERLVADFSDSRFTAFLLDGQRKLLSRIASEKFLELSGHYVFDDEGKFQIIDQATGDMRSPDTLSGGETFLASLSLALALAEAVALEGGRLGCFFLDEGFGSLDTESLDLALDAIESLAEGSGRLIGLISHVGGIQARLDDLIVLERLVDGSTEVAQFEGPIGYAPALI